jgi:hypothetical protein
MSKWTRVKAAALAATTVVAAFQFFNCVGRLGAQRLYELIAIGNLFD